MTRGNGNFVTVVPLQDALEIDPTLLTQEMEARPGDVIVTRVFHLEHIDTTNATTLLNNMKLSVAISPIPATGTLIVTGYSYRMGRVEQLLKMVDVPGKPRKFRYRVLKYTMAKTLAPKVKTLAEQLGTVSITISQTTTPSPLTARGRTATRPAVRPPTTTTQAKPTQATVYLDADERTNRILMIGLEDQLSVVEELIDALDVEQQDLRALKLYKIEFMDAEDVRKKLQELGVIGGSAGGTTTSSRITTPTTGRAATTTRPATIAQQATTRTTGNGPEALVEEPQVVVIEATNSLLVNATAEQHAQVSMILDYIDREIQKDEMPYKIYPLENQKPEDLAGVLEQLVQETIKDKEGKVEQVIKRQEDNIVIVPDENTFSIIVYASKKNQEWIANLIEQLDKRRPQVLIDVALVEITRTELFEYDLNIIANAKKLVTGNIAISGSVLPYASSVGNHLEAGWNLKDADGNPTGQIQGFYGEDKMQALFKAMDKKDYGRILAQPKVLVNDNEKGIISTVEKTYVKEETTLVPPDGIAQTATKWTEYPAKIELQITPNISEGELLRLEINMTREDFEKQTDKPPDYRTSNVTTVVTVPNGSTIILGGLTKLNQSKGGSKVPLLGDIPLVGGLFRSVANSDRASKLYIFVKANILRPEETVGLAQLQRISEENRAAFEEAERIFQDKRTIPGLKDKYMEPERVLGNIQLRKRVSPRVLSDTK